MDDPMIPDIFCVVAACAFIFFLWKVVLASAKRQLLVEDHNTAKFFLTIISISLGGIVVHYGSDILGLVFRTTTPF